MHPTSASYTHNDEEEAAELSAQAEAEYERMHGPRLAGDSD